MTTLPLRPAPLLLLLLCVLGVTVVLARRASRPAASQPVVTADGAGAVWSRDPRASSRLAVRAGVLARLPHESGVWRRSRDGVDEVQDRLTVGGVNGDDAFVVAAALRRSPDDLSPSLFVDLARTAADAGFAVRRLTPGETYRGRFGETQTARVSFARAWGTAAVREGCTAWRTEAGGVGMALLGVACLPGLDEATPARVECFLRSLAVPEGMEEGAASAGADAACEPALPSGGRVASSPRVARTRGGAKLSPISTVGADSSRAID